MGNRSVTFYWVLLRDSKSTVNRMHGLELEYRKLREF